MIKTIITTTVLTVTFTAFAYDPNGGIVEKRTAIPSKQICVTNCQSTIPAEEVERMTKDVRMVASLPVLVNAPKSPAVIELRDTSGVPALTLFPEEFRAVINVAALASDGAVKTTVVERVEKEMIRAGFYLMGSGYGSRDCITKSIRSVKELDAMMLERPSLESFTRLRGGQKNGIRPIQWITYRHACQLGIAPQPVTEDQKRVWDEVHNPPEKPMKITYDKDKQKPVVK